MQCKDIPDELILKFLAGPYRDWPVAGWATWFWSDTYQPANRIFNVLPPGVNDKLALAKMQKLISRGLADGCACGCRGDFEITNKGRAFLASKAVPTPS